MNDYIVATFIVVWFVLLMYVSVVAMRTAKMSREVELLSRLIERDRTAAGGESGSADSEVGGGAGPRGL